MEPRDAVQAEILRAVGVLGSERVRVADARGRVTAASVVAGEDVPPFANSAMDGYALRAADTAGARPDSPVHLAVSGELAAGRAPTVAVAAGHAIRIMTGAPIPEGADAVVMVEHTDSPRRPVEGATEVAVHRPAHVGDHIRPAAGDLARGDEALAPGTWLRPAHLGVLASLAVTEVEVHRRPRVAVMSTGDELRDDHGPLAPGQIRDSNRPMLCALVAEAGGVPEDLGHAPDDEAEVVARLERATSDCDAVITSGGVSVGDYDVVKAVLDRMGVLRWWQIAIKPAKPLAFGMLGAVPVFGLPGNPVSSHVSFELFARPALLHMGGHRRIHRLAVEAVAGEAFRRRPDGRIHFVRVALEQSPGGAVARSAGGQGSNVLSAMAGADGLAVLPDGPGVDEGGRLVVLLLDGPPA